MRQVRMILIVVIAMVFLGCTTHKEPSINLDEKVKELQSILDNGNGDIIVKLEDNNKTINVSFENDILFELGKYKIKSEFEETLGSLSAFLIENPKFGVLIEGHTDSTGDIEYNQKLSEKRANAVESIFSSYNILESRMITVGYGEEAPKYDNSNEENRKKNRRAEIKLKEDIKDLIQASISRKNVGEVVSWTEYKEIDSDDCLNLWITKICHSVTYRFRYSGVITDMNIEKQKYRIKLSDVELIPQNRISMMYGRYKNRAINWGHRQIGSFRTVKFSNI